MTKLIPSSFEALAPGERFGPVTIVADEHFAKRYAFAVDDDNALRLLWNHQQVVQTALLADLLRLMNLKFDPNDEYGLQQREEFWLCRPVPLHEVVELSAVVTNKFVKRNRGYYTIEAIAQSQRDGTVFVKHRATDSTEIGVSNRRGDTSAPKQGTRWVEGKVPAGVPSAERASIDLRPRTPVFGPIKTVSQDQMSVFSNVGEFWRTIHTDRGYAQRTGLRDTVAQGLMTACYVSEMAAAFFGEGWFTGGWLNLAFVAPVYAGDTIRTIGLVTRVQPNAARIEFEMEVWAENQTGSRVAVGWLGSSEARGR